MHAKWNMGIITLGVVMAVAAAAAVASFHVLAFMVILAVMGGTMLLTLGTRLPTVFLLSLGVLLVGYAFFGRSFAYLGFSPLYVGEIVLGLGALAFALSSRHRLSADRLLLIAFIALGAIHTIPFVREYGLDAIRDAALWYYALLALFVSVLLRPDQLARLPDQYRRFIPWFLMWLPVAFVASSYLEDALPRVPGSTIPMVTFKGGDVGIHLAGITAFFILGMYSRSPTKGRVPQGVLWLLWFVPVGLVAASNRGGFLALGAVIGCLMVFRPGREWFRLTYVGASVLVILVVINPSFDYGGNRDISVTQIVNNVSSLFGSSETASQNSTRDWRLEWWQTIYGYTVEGPYFWEGKGFGINLADADGFQVMADRSLRSPHSSHMTILARMGVPGLLLWLALQVSLGFRLCRAFFVARSQGRQSWAQLNGWLFCYWLAMIINASFDVYLEGPQGGIWFWCVYGVSLAALRVQAAERKRVRIVTPSRRPAMPATSALASHYSSGDSTTRA